MNLATVHLPDTVRGILISAVTEVFATMFGTEVKPAALVPEASGQTVLAGSVGFIGDVNGIVYIRTAEPFARVLSGRMLGLQPDELDDEMVNDALGELSNMVVGCVKSHLCDQGLPCVLTIPSVVRGTDLTVETIPCAERRLLSFRCEEHQLRIELLIKTKP